MLPFDQRPWAKTLATTVIVFSVLGALGLAYYFYSTDSLHISEVVGIILLLLTIISPNGAILLRKHGDNATLHHPISRTPVR